WSDYDTPEEGCNDADNDGFCDAPYAIPGPSGVESGNQDNFPWTTRDGWKGKTVKVAVILAELSDVKHTSASKTEQPCKLIPAKTYPNGHDKTYYDDMMYCVKDYYRENSYGTVNVEYTVFPMWYKLTKPTRSYVGVESKLAYDAIVKSGINLSGYDIVSVVHSGDSKQMTGSLAKLSTASWNNKVQPIPNPPYAMTIAEQDPLGLWAHETGHMMGELSPNHTITADVYLLGNMDKTNYGTETNQFAAWDLMALGAHNHLEGEKTGTSPSHMSSYTKEFLGWLTPEIHKKSEYRTYSSLKPLELQNFGDKTLHYNMSETTEINTGTYYQIEARKRIGDWGVANPVDSAVVLYKVNTYNRSPYGFGGILWLTPNSARWDTDVMGVLETNEAFEDPDNLVRFTNVGMDSVSPYLASVKTERILPQDVSNKKTGAVLLPTDFLGDNLFFLPIFFAPFAPGMAPDDNLTKMMDWTLQFRRGVLHDLFDFLFIIPLVLFIWVMTPRFFKTKPKKTRLTAKIFLSLLFGTSAFWLYEAAIQYGIHTEYFRFSLWNNGNMAPSIYTNPAIPDLDLHAVTPDGRHIGMNYQTEKFENQIAGSMTSGDMGGSEWIFVPSTETVRYYVSAHDTQAFFDANPDIASQVPDKTDKYELYARTIDPATGIFTSATTTQTILPGVADFYQITGTTTPSVIQTDANAKDLISLFRSLVSSISMPKPLRQILLSETNIIEKLLAKNRKKPALALIQSEKRMIQLFACGTKKTDIFAGMLSEKNAMNLLAKDGVDKTDINGMNGMFNQFGRSQKCGLAKSDAELLLGVLGKLEGVVRK
ncbi:MAG: hypothetical protein WCT48_04905, partial [Candidatus Paceibacterota bacterium]